jgi:UDP-N-acetylglucosamine--N-acetylmuramyl-(pentapeptide) pyrophosphoryl-undecaprenol N-acetylglucosamine transferase
MPDDAPILLSAGGTGGHLFPAEALAHELLARGRKVAVVTDKRGQAFKSLGPGVSIHIVRAATLKGGVTGKIRAVINMGIGVVEALRLVRKIRPAVIVGFGGYPSFPAVFAGQLLKVTTALHEQNAVLGKANAVLADGAAVIATSLPETQGLSVANRKKIVLTGIPLRPHIAALEGRAYAPPSDMMKILVTGGSQAARIFSEIVPVAAGLLPPGLKARLFVMHQARPDDLAVTEERYKAAGVKAEVAPFFADMAERLGGAHLFIGRSGASSVAEAAVASLPSIFVPLRHKDMQQKYNAESVTGRGGGWLMMQEDFTPESLAQKLREFMENPAILAAASQKAKACGRTDAAKRLADLVESKVLKT